jgi:hypothetical protein
MWVNFKDIILISAVAMIGLFCHYLLTRKWKSLKIRYYEKQVKGKKVAFRIRILKAYKNMISSLKYSIFLRLIIENYLQMVLMSLLIVDS